MRKRALKLFVTLLASGLFLTYMLGGVLSFAPADQFPLASAQTSLCSGCSTAVQCPYGNCLMPPTITPTLPADSKLADQSDFNCFAWQQFIALNWKASTYPGQPDTSVPASNFGEPGDFSPVVWMTYKEAGEVFKPDASQPSPWTNPQQLPASLKLSTQALKSKQLVYTNRVGYHTLYATSKVSEDAKQTLDSILQAGTNAWLTAQSRNVTYYERRINEDEFNYITNPQNQFYNAENQLKAMQSGKGISLPDGTPGSSQYCPPSQYPCVGAIEIKAAWIEITDQSLWSQYLMADAVIVDNSTKPPTVRPAKVGLVGLHIIHKTKNAQQFAWATFEHVNNAPDINQVNNKTVGSGYAYYNPNCDPKTDPFQCQQNYQPKPTDPMNVPIQVVRMNPIDNTTNNPIVGLNCGVQSLIKKSNSNSVFQYYQLVNVLWPQSNTIITPASIAPLAAGNPQPPAPEKVANATMETYVQKQLTCLDCHMYAPIAKVPKVSPTPPKYASDYSFLFSTAKVPPPGKTTPAKRRPARPVRRNR